MTQRHLKARAGFFSLIAASAMLASCGGHTAGHQMRAADQMHPVKVAESIERLELYARPNGLELSLRDQGAVAAFMDDYARRGSGPLYINRPAGQAGGLGAQATDRLVGSMIARAGIPAQSVQGGEYYSRPGDPAPTVISYRTLRTVPQDCTRGEDLSRTFDNSVSQNFGCFASANLAAMIADPRQLIEPYAQGLPNAQRRQVIYDKYIAGEPTGATRPADQQINSQESN